MIGGIVVLILGFIAIRYGIAGVIVGASSILLALGLKKSS